MFMSKKADTTSSSEYDYEQKYPLCPVCKEERLVLVGERHRGKCIDCTGGPKNRNEVYL